MDAGVAVILKTPEPLGKTLKSILESEPEAVRLGLVPVAEFVIVKALTALDVELMVKRTFPLVSSMDVISFGRVAIKFPLPAVTFVPLDVKPEMPPKLPELLY